MSPKLEIALYAVAIISLLVCLYFLAKAEDDDDHWGFS